MSEKTIERFITKNAAVKGRKKQTHRTWRRERVAESGFFAFNFRYKEQDVRSQEDMIVFWGYTKYLEQNFFQDASAADIQLGMRTLSLSSI